MSNSSLHLSPVEALQALQAGACWLVDVREGHEVARLAYDHPRVICLPLSQLGQALGQLPQDGELIMACAAGGRSQQAMQFLLQNGRADVRNMSGGMGAWMAHGLPVKQGVV